MKKAACTLSLWLTLAALASAAPTTTYNLTQDAGLALTNPVGSWTFLYATSGVTTPTSFTTFTNQDWWPPDNREMWYHDTGNVWSVPAVRIYNYTNPSTRAVQLLISDTVDTMVKWASQGNDTATITGTFNDEITDGDTVGSRLAIYNGSTLLTTIWAPSNSTTSFSLTTPVTDGDNLYFRKLNNGVDAWGVRYSILDVTIAVPEPACLSLLALGVVALARRRR